jgi:hypothetical protein
LAGDPAAAAELGAEGCGLLEELGDVAFLSSAAATLARSLYALDRLDEADVWSGRAAELGASDDAFTQMSSKEIRAMVRARRGEHVEAERLAREALAIGETTHWLDGQGDAHADLAEVLVLGGKHGEATVALELALACFKRKGNVVSAARVQARLTALASLP